MNGWLDPTTVGNFNRTVTNDVRTSLTLEELPSGIPGAVPPNMDDLRLIIEEHPISAGDTLAVEINELRQRQIPYQVQAQVALPGYVNLPLVGRVQAAGLTVPEFEEDLVEAIRERDVLLDPEVTVNPLFLQRATYSVFGIGVSASSDSPLRAGTFPIRRPDLRILEAINQVGGLNEFVTEVFIFRSDPPPKPVAESPVKESKTTESDAGSGRTTREQELIEAVAPEVKKDPAPQRKDDIPEALEPDPTQPYIFVNKEFVPNPAYSGPRAEIATAPPDGPMGTVAPAFNWSQIAGDTSYRVLVVPAESLRNGDPDANIYIRAGDVIRIFSGEIGVYYVMGQVNRVGTFRFELEKITLKSAIAAAGGLSSLAWPDRCTVYRRLGQREQMIQVNLDRIFAGLDPDFTIKRGDIINVGTHPFAPFLEIVRGLTLPNPVSNVGYSFTYARNFADIDSFSVRTNPHNEPDLFPRLFP